VYAGVGVADITPANLASSIHSTSTPMLRTALLLHLGEAYWPGAGNSVETKEGTKVFSWLKKSYPRH